MTFSIKVNNYYSGDHMHKLLVYILLLLNVLMVGNSHGYNCNQNDIHSSEISKSLELDNQDSQSPSQENSTTAGHHCCPVCHAHVVMIFMQNVRIADVNCLKKELTVYSYNNLHSTGLKASPFRPPIA